MYLGNISGYGTSDFNKALKGTNVAAIEKGLAFQEKQLAKRKPKDTKGIANDMAQIAAAKSRLAQLAQDPAGKAVLTKVPVPVAVAQSAPQVIAANAGAASVAPPTTVPNVTAPPVVTLPTPVTVSPMPQAQPPVPTIAPPNAAESFMPNIYQPPSLFTPPPAATPDTATPVAEAPKSNMPLILGAGALGLAALFFLGKKGKR
jgi:hypothetical protein